MIVRMDRGPIISEKRRTVGVISDTHGVFRPEVEKAFEGVDMIVHAGDVGSPEVLGLLKAIAPVTAVRGNMDKGKWARELQDTEVVEAGESVLYVLHDINRLDLDPAAAGFGAVIFGHSHRPSVVREKGVLFLNPGSAGPRRFILPVFVAILSIGENSLDARFVALDA
jgi:putative phosphoesterase